MTSRERMYALYKAVEYIIDEDIPGDFVECGVWRGGSAMIMAATLIAKGRNDRCIHLYDTFDGMPPPGPLDEDFAGRPASALLAQEPKGPDSHIWGYAVLDYVKDQVARTGYPMDNLKFIVGKVEYTLPEDLPVQLALLRLDTDWYESTRHELKHLYPLLSPGGVLIVDDYGHWRGSKRAVDEYLAEAETHLQLHEIDYAGRIAVKPLG
jgi:hypothetical protein